jgi:K+-transporting ATPase ATPase C chain
MMWVNLRRAVIVSALLTVLLGLAYPLAATGIGRALFPRQAAGSIGANGSVLIGQQWTGPQWFHGRPDGDDPAATGGSNLGPRSKEQLDLYRQRVRALTAEGITPTPDLVAASGSGVDPDISPVAAYAQVPSVARARHLPEATVRSLVAAHIAGPQFGFLGGARVTVLTLNEALARLR